MTSDQAGQYTQDMSGQAGLDNSYSQVENTDPVHNTSVMESPTSIGSVEIPQAYTDQSCSVTPMSGAPVHPAAIPNNSPSNTGLHPSASIQGSSPGNPPTSNQSPHNSSINQSPSAAIHNNITNQSPHHTTPISQSPHPIQSPHPPMQPSPHNQQSSPHPPIINSQITSPYTNLPHQSPTGSVGYVAPPQPQQRQPSSSGHTSKSPRAPSSRSSQQQQQQQQQLSAQQQAAQAQLRMHQAAAAQYYHYGAAAMEHAGKQHRSHEAAAGAYPLFGSSSVMFPATSNAGRSSHTGHMDATQAQAAVAAHAQFYPQQAVPGVAVPSHSSH